MSTTVSVKTAPRVVASRVDPFTTGANDTIEIDLPVSTASGVPVAGVQLAVDASKLWVASLSLAASTPVTLDLAALATGKGDAAFADVTLLAVYNLEASGSGRKCRLGNEGSGGEWYDPLGTAGSVLDVPAARARVLDRAEATGWTVGTRHLLKLDPGANPCAVVVVIAGH